MKNGSAEIYTNEFLETYLRMVEETESPRLFHIWSALSGISACLGRRCYLDFGMSRIFPNIFVLLTGLPAVRKSTAVNIIDRLLRESTSIKFAPDNTGGKHQGLVAAMTETAEDGDDALEKALNAAITGVDVIKVLNEVNVSDEKAKIHADDKHFIYVSCSEFTAFIGEGNRDFLTFLGKIYDGEPYRYKLRNKKDSLSLDAPLVTMLGGTTPTNIMEALPKAAIGQGFTSRVIFVFGGKKYKDIAWPRTPDQRLVEKVKATFSKLYYEYSGPIQFDDNAKTMTERYYKAPQELNDPRFVHYLARRDTHLKKLAMLMAASRLSFAVTSQDVEVAQNLLVTTERNMPDALGEYGMSPIAAATQQILELIMNAQEPVSMEIVHACMRRDLRLFQTSQVLRDLEAAGKIQTIVSAVTGRTCYIPNISVIPEQVKLMEALTNSPTTETPQ